MITLRLVVNPTEGGGGPERSEGEEVDERKEREEERLSHHWPNGIC